MRYRLTCGALTAGVDTMGGELVSLVKDGVEYIWQGDPAFWSGRNPLLFPIVGSLKDGAVLIGEKEYRMDRHGFARRQEFALIERGAGRAVMELRHSEETMARYPFPFSLRVEHRLTEVGFVTALTVKNTGSGEMPFCIGAHTAFRCPLMAGERFEDYVLVFPQPERAGTLPLTAAGLLSGEPALPMLEGETTIPLDRKVFQSLDTIILAEHRSRSVRLVHKKTGRGVQMEFEDFPLLAFWSPGGCEAPFVCVEPWHGCAACLGESGQLAEKPHCILLEPGESRTLSYTVTLIEHQA